MLLSVCVPTFNRCRFVRLSARYWLEQLGPFRDRVELIIADNASTDDTVSILRSYREKEPFRLIERNENLGFNLSVHDLVTRQALGDYVWVCGDDDYLNAGTLAHVVHAIETHREQDHFYLNTPFVPEDHAPDVAREDPRESPHRRGAMDGTPDGVLPQTSKILELDSGGFGGFYSSIWRRPLAIEALSGEFLTKKPFHSLEATLPYSVFVARHRLQKPCCRIAHPALTVVHTVCWPQYTSLFRLKIMPDLYDLYEQNGVPPAPLKRYRDELLDHWPREYLDLIRRRGTDSTQDFSFPRYLVRHFFKARFWTQLFRYIWCDLLP